MFSSSIHVYRGLRLSSLHTTNFSMYPTAVRLHLVRCESLRTREIVKIAHRAARMRLCSSKSSLSVPPISFFFPLILTLFLLLFVSSNSLRAVRFPPCDPSGIPTGILYRILSAAFKFSQPKNEIPRARSHTKRTSHQTVRITTQLSALFEQFMAHGAVHKCN